MGSPQRNQFLGRVSANVALCREHYRLTIRLENFPPTEPGQFVQLACRDPQPEHSAAGGEQGLSWEADRPIRLEQPELREPMAVLRRPFSLAARREEALGRAVEIDVIHRVVGLGTHWLSKLAEGDELSVLGPLGNRFALPGPGQTALLVGGGVGIPPMIYLAQFLASRAAASAPPAPELASAHAVSSAAAADSAPAAIAFCGAMSADLLPMTVLPTICGIADPDAVCPAMVLDEFARYRIPSVITTDDGSLGFRGYVTQALERFLDANSISNAIIYTCGPEIMLRRVATIANERGIECQVAVERAMACGMGTCQSCVIRLRRPAAILAAGTAGELPEGGGADWVYRLACTDGPVFRGDQLLW